MTRTYNICLEIFAIVVSLTPRRIFKRSPGGENVKREKNTLDENL